MQFEPLLAKAERYIRSARLLAEDQDFDSSASRIYYAMFYTAEALLESRGLTFSSHRAVISAFGQHFIKTNESDQRFHQALLSSFSQRQLGDYAVSSGLYKEDIDRLMIDAIEFIKVSREWLERYKSKTG
jgi:uncharacterized protein (UPF0332 family)